MPKIEKDLAVIDFETDPFQYGVEPRPFAAGYYTSDDYQKFWGDDCVEQLIDYLKDESPRVIYAHNGGKFDFFFMLDYLDEKLKIINGRISQASILNGLHELRDSYLILPMPLKTHGKKVISYRKFRKQFREKYKQEILSYLYYDCASLYDWVKSFRDLYGSGLTLAGAAFKQLKQTDYPVSNTYTTFDERFRPFYFGGRVQCFKVGSFHGKYKYVDINSAYPFAMMSKHWNGASYLEVFKLPKTGDFFAIIDAVSKGALPTKVGGKLFFPDDSICREYYASGWEILAGLETNTLTIINIKKIYVPTFTNDFSEYVEKFFTIKLQAEKDGDTTARTFAKLMLNSCYGKFGQDGRKYEKFAIAPLGGYPEGDGWASYSDLESGHCIFSQPDPSDNFYNVATAASITGFVRAYLWRAICTSGGVLYCDTDAILCSEFAGDVGDKLGQWDIEAEPVEIHIAQRKMYAIKMGDGSTKKACKGVRLSFNQIKSGVENKQNNVFKRAAPAYSLKYGARFFTREINFKDYEKNASNNPPTGVE